MTMKVKNSYAELVGKHPAWLATVSARTAHSLSILHGFKSLKQLKTWTTTHKVSELRNLGRAGQEEVSNLAQLF